MVKVLFPVHDPSDEWDGSSVEGMWCPQVGTSAYRLMNLPCEANGVAFEDVVEVHVLSGALVMCRVLERSGNAHYRVSFDRTQDLTTLRLAWFGVGLAGLGVEYDPSFNPLFPAFVPAGADLDAVERALNRLQDEHEASWEVAFRSA